MSIKYKIRVLTCYYGDFPWYFPYFLHTCKYNPTVDFLIISDVEYGQELPENVALINIPWEELKATISQKLDLEVQIKSPYKLCDFKPAYGMIFPELIRDYDFWGHGDLDVIFGDIRNFITEEVLEGHDLICVRHDFLTGYFTLFRNCKRVNELFTHSKDYKKVLTSPKHYCFDETNFRFCEYSEYAEKIPVPDEIIIESMMDVVYRLRNEDKLKTYFNHHVIEGTPGKLMWENGKLYYKNQFEVLLYHMIRFKTICKSKNVPQFIPESFSITPDKIIH